MSEPIPESIPTSADPRSRRPTKKRALTPVSAQASQIEALFAKPDRDIPIPLSATKDGVTRALPPPPEIVANVQGSSAGAGSGEFHVYKASRRREYERIRIMEEEVRKETEAEEFERKQEELRRKDEAKTNKNKARREKMKARKQKIKGEGNIRELPADEGDNARTPTQVNRREQSHDKATVEGHHGKAGGGDYTATSREPNGDQRGAEVLEEIGVTIHDDD